MSQAKNVLFSHRVIPESLQNDEGKTAIYASPKLQRLIDKIQADLAINVRWFLEEHCGVTGARDLKTPMEDIKLRMQLLRLNVVHVVVTQKPQLTGMFIFQGNQAIVTFPDRKIKNGKLLPQNMIRLKNDAIQIITAQPHLAGRA